VQDRPPPRVVRVNLSNQKHKQQAKGSFRAVEHQLSGWWAKLYLDSD
jgi:hypothetical protein